MKKIFALITFTTIHLLVEAQCSTVSVSVSASDTSYVQLYHAGFFNIPSGFANICAWEVSSFSGETVYQDITSGDANKQGRVLFDHSIPISDSMKVSIMITNEIENIICTINDTLYWKETEVLPGSFIGNWEVLNSNGGVEEELTSSDEATKALTTIKLLPSPARDYLRIEGSHEIYTFSILALNGQTLKTYYGIQSGEEVNISFVPSGMFFVQVRDKHNNTLCVRKSIKI